MGSLRKRDLSKTRARTRKGSREVANVQPWLPGVSSQELCWEGLRALGQVQAKANTSEQTRTGPLLVASKLSICPLHQDTLGSQAQPKPHPTGTSALF